MVVVVVVSCGIHPGGKGDQVCEDLATVPPLDDCDDDADVVEDSGENVTDL